MKSIKIGLIGFGTIGAGVVKILGKNGDTISKRLGASVEIAKIADLEKSSSAHGSACRNGRKSC